MGLFALRRRFKNPLDISILPGGASSAPPVGPMLGQYQINIVDFCETFNSCSEYYREGTEIRIRTIRTSASSFFFFFYPPTLKFLICQFTADAKLQGNIGVLELWNAIRLVSVYHSIPLAKARCAVLSFLSSSNLAIDLPSNS